ncbi:MAG: methionine synthase, partial [Planctomycetota bacterium]
LQDFDRGPADFGGEATEGCPECLVVHRSDVVSEIHRRYLAAGADVIETNSFGALPHVLGEYGIAEQAYALARGAARLAVAAARAASTPEGPRFVAGSLGPGSKLPSLGHIGWHELYASYRTGARGLIAGGVDLLLVETAQDILQVRCAVLACREAMWLEGRELPLQAQVTLEQNGAMLTGTDLPAALCALANMPVDVIGLNCATGPDLMEPHLAQICATTDRFVACLPNAGLPRNVGGKAVFDLSPEELAGWHRHFVDAYGVDACGGCCGTGPEHIAAVAAALREPVTKRERAPAPSAQVAGLFGAVDLRQDSEILYVGERTNATGSKRFRESLLADDWQHIVGMAQEQAAEGAHVLDVSLAWTGRDELRDIDEVYPRLRGTVPIPIMVDSTDPAAMARALEQLPGCPVINSVNFENGTERFDAICRLARRHGAALVCLAIDEEGMARTTARKLAVAERMYRRATEVHGIPGCRLLFDLLTFPITQGDEESRPLAAQTLAAIERFAAEHDEVGFILGLSNVSFGLKANARRVLNSVFLDEARRHSLSAAILDTPKIVPIDKLSSDELALTRDLIHDRRRFADDGSCSYDPLFSFIDHFASRTVERAAGPADDADQPPERRIHTRILRGSRAGLEGLLDEARAQGWTPLGLINDVLLAAMQEVGERFGAGTMQLPFVLQAAECMKASMAHLEQFMDRDAAATKGRFVLATVKGDVHDIGKNLVGIILANNGYTVIDIGIKQSVDAIIAAVAEHGADAVGMSGLLVKSTEIMRDNLRIMAERGLRLPVICGGAALNRRFVEQDLRTAYGCDAVYYARDAFAGLHVMDAISTGTTPSGPPAPTVTATARRDGVIDATGPATAGASPILRDELAAVPPPAPPFWGRAVRTAEAIDLEAVRALLNRRALFRGRWGFTGDVPPPPGRPGPEELLASWNTAIDAEHLIEPAIVYGYFPAAAEDRALIVFDPETGAERCRFELPRARSGHCISDYLRPRGAEPLGDEATCLPAAAYAVGARDLLLCQCVTVGERAMAHAQALHAADRYSDYVLFHGLAVELAEALAEYAHRAMRHELGIAGDDAAAVDELLRGGYRGRRYSFGYPACPELADQRPLGELLGWEDIGVSLSESCQLVPEASTSAIGVHHPQARYFAL